MFSKVQGSLLLQLSLLLSLLIMGVSGISLGLVFLDAVPVWFAFLLSAVVVSTLTVFVLREYLKPLRTLTEVTGMMVQGENVTVKATSLDEIGQLARAFKSLHTSTRAATARFDTTVIHLPSPEVMAVGSVQPTWSRRLMVLGLPSLGAIGLFGPPIYDIATIRSRHAVTVSALPSSDTKVEVILPVLPRGVTKDSITMGMSAPFSGSARTLSDGVKLGVETAFAEVNAAGGVHGRQLKLVALDNKYDEKLAMDTTKELVEVRHVFGLIGNVGTPTVKASLPYVLANKVLLFGPVTGSPILRKDPPDRYVFNVRAGYEPETSSMVSYLLDVKHISARNIVVFAQADSFGDAGYAGAVHTLRKKGVAGDLYRVGYERNSADVATAVSQVLAYNTATSKLGGVRAVIVVATAAASAAFTARISSLDAIVLNVSFVDAAQLASEFKDHWPGSGSGVIVTQVVPHPDADATGVIRYRESLKTFFPDKSPGFASLEGYVVGSLFVEGLRRAGPGVDTEKLIDALEKIQGLDLGTGSVFNFGVSQHQASQKVWGTELTTAGTFKPLDSEWME